MRPRQTSRDSRAIAILRSGPAHSSRFVAIEITWTPPQSHSNAVDQPSSAILAHAPSLVHIKPVVGSVLAQLV
jgi:hypothetical protein